MGIIPAISRRGAKAGSVVDNPAGTVEDVDLTLIPEFRIESYAEMGGSPGYG